MTQDIITNSIYTYIHTYTHTHIHICIYILLLIVGVVISFGYKFQQETSSLRKVALSLQPTPLFLIYLLYVLTNHAELFREKGSSFNILIKMEISDITERSPKSQEK